MNETTMTPRAAIRHAEGRDTRGGLGREAVRCRSSLGTGTRQCTGTEKSTGQEGPRCGVGEALRSAGFAFPTGGGAGYRLPGRAGPSQPAVCPAARCRRTRIAPDHGDAVPR